MNRWEERFEEDALPFLRRRWYCPECGKWQTYGETPYCPYCGTHLIDEKEEETA